MSIKHVITTGFVTIFSTAVAMAGCSPDSASDTEGNEVASGDSQAVAVTVDCTANSPSGLSSPNYLNAIAATETTVISAINNGNTSYDISPYCTAAINARRQTVHTRTKSGVTSTMQPYYDLYDTNIVPAYSAIVTNVNATTGSSVCHLCKGLADAQVGNHAGYGMCFGIAPDATGPTTNEVSVGWCGAAIGATAQQVVDSCLNSFESEQGDGHKGPIVFDSTRGVSCTIGVYVDPTTGAQKGGISINYSYAPRNAAALNGASCKISGECLSKSCSNGRCVGFASSTRIGSTTPTTGVSTCPAADSKNCTEHLEDTWTCFSKNLACASGVCTNSLCGKGITGKACATNADCTSNVCNTTTHVCQ